MEKVVAYENVEKIMKISEYSVFYSLTFAVLHFLFNRCVFTSLNSRFLQPTNLPLFFSLKRMIVNKKRVDL